MKTTRTTTVRMQGKLLPGDVTSALLTQLPVDVRYRPVQFRIRVPSGGDYSGMELSSEDFEVTWVCEYTTDD